MNSEGEQMIKKQVGKSRELPPLIQLQKINRSLEALGCVFKRDEKGIPLRKVVGGRT